MAGRSFSFAGEAASRALLPLVLVVGGALIVSQLMSATRLEYAFAVAAAVVVFLLAFMRTEFGLYLVILSMLLSPEFSMGGGLAEGRSIVFRAEDFLLLIIAASWFAKTAVYKEIGLVLKTPLNRPILYYVMATLCATLVGYLFNTVQTATGFFYVLKYVEYFVVYYMVVNNLSDRAQMRRLVAVAVATAAIVSLIGIAQIPSGDRVSAPFEGESGEPNTLGGYLLFMMAALLGVALETTNRRLRVGSLALVGLFLVPFAFTLSRASYLGLIPTLAVMAALSSRRRVMIGVLAVALVASPLIATLLPAPVTKRIAYTFQPESGHPTLRFGRLAFDPSTSARFVSFTQALAGWLQRPILGWGVTGFGFMDAQYARTLVETGIVGLVTFLWLVWSLLRAGYRAFRTLPDPDDRGIALGFIAGVVGLLVHGLGANTFIIVRIMEPFWLFAGIVVMLPILSGGERGVPAATRPPARPPLGGPPRVRPVLR
jgi:O-antigen ligase